MGKVDARERLKEEYSAWKHHHPQGFEAKPDIDEDGECDWYNWRCAIPGMKKTPWEGGLYKLNMHFPSDYPYSPPKCMFDPPLFHPNVFPTGTVSLSLIDKKKDWKPQITIRQVLVGIQLLLNDPNFNEPAQAEAFAVFNSEGKMAYDEKIEEQAQEMRPKADR